MHQDEMRLVRQCPLADQKAALHVWSIKEAAAKAFGINLAEAWQAVRVMDLGDRQSCYAMGGRNMTAHHALVDNHLVTLVAEP